jgi:hypothetical protein
MYVHTFESKKRSPKFESEVAELIQLATLTQKLNFLEFLIQKFKKIKNSIFDFLIRNLNLKNCWIVIDILN